MFDLDLTAIVAGLPGLIIALTFHELAHAVASTYFGDPTPRMQGRLTANPLAHLDPLGSIMLLLTMIGAAPIGWAKPVMVNPMYWRGDKMRANLVVSAAGPATNLLIAFLGMIALVFLSNIEEAWTILVSLIKINISLAVFNMLPVPPLDGSKVLASLLPGDRGTMFFQFEQYGPIILLILIITGVTDMIMGPVMKLVISAMWGFVNLFV